MTIEQLRKVLESVSSQSLSIDDALTRLRSLPFEQLEFATVDHHRALRCGHPEVIFCPNKAVPHLLEIAMRLANTGQRVLATRASAEQIAALRAAFPDALVNETARAIIINPGTQNLVPRAGAPAVAVVSAGTSDSPVSEEALMTLRSMGVPTHRITDVGVAGLHRLLPHVGTLQQCCAVVAVAGMEGALPSVIGGLVACPVFAVPTSVGYGASMGGLAALLAMLNSCSSNISVVNIDNGFGAAFSASLVYQQVTKATTHSEKPSKASADLH